jgi:FMN phosphatase YigB (HAD superfamily)
MLMKLTRDTLLLDVDGVLLNWVDGFNKWIHEYHMPAHAHLNFQKDNVKDDVYDISERYGIPGDIIYAYVKIFNNSLHFGRLEAMPDAVRTVTKFIFMNWNVHTASSYSSCRLALEARLKNIEREISPTVAYSIHHQLDLDNDKHQVLEQYKNCNQRVVFVDDKPLHVQEALDLDIEAYLFDAPYNRTSNLERVTWDSLLEKYYK